MSRNLILCGFMGSGKTTVGRRLAKMLERPFLDIDAYIEEKQGMTITDIFAQQGEEAFRRMEREACAELATQDGLIIGCGGGTVLREENARLLKQNGIILLLDVPLPLLQKRLRYDKKRPLLQKPNRAKVISDLYKERIPLYRAAADHRVRPRKTVYQTAQYIAHTYGQL